MIVTTIVARNYVAHARVLAASFLRHHPGARFVTLVVDGDDRDRGSTPGIGDVVVPRDLGLDAAEWEQMASIYSVIELATALKPALLRWLLRNGADAAEPSPAVLYLDPDMQVFSPFPEVFDIARRSGIALTPHVLTPLPRDGLEPDEGMLMRAGIFNLGFLCVGHDALAFLEWWHERLRVDAVIDPERGLFTDQRWVDWLPSLFPFEVVRDHGLNVAYWNIHERPFMPAVDGGLLAGGARLKLFHFSGFDPDQPKVLSKHVPHRPRVVQSDHPTVALLCENYAESLFGAGYAEQRAVPYGLGVTRNGTKLTSVARLAYRSAIKDARTTGATPPPGPFAPDGGEGFANWLTSPNVGPADIELATWELQLWRQRPDLQTVFAEPGGIDAHGYRDWLDHDTSARLLRSDLNLPGRSTGDDRRAVRIASGGNAAPGFGWNVVGYHAAELGVGEAGRRMNAVLEHAGVPTELVAVSADGSREQHRLRRPVRHSVVYRRSLYCVNADQLAHAVVATDPGAPSDDRETRGRRIGFWFWEVDEFPRRWMSAFDLVDAVWCASPFTATAIAAVSPIPVRVVPLPIWEPIASMPYSRAQLGLPEEFVFLCMADFHSVFERKNPLGALAAYTRAFGPNDGATLVIKSINGASRPAELDRLRDAVAERPDVVVMDGYVDAPRVQGLIEQSDCLVSLHRSEGFGLNLANAMAVGRPVIATGYSGNLAFMDDTSAFLVPYELVPVGPGNDPYPPTAHWADPDLDVAAALMRHVFDDRGGASNVGERGRRAVLACNGMAHARAVIQELLMQEEPWWPGAEEPVANEVPMTVSGGR